MSTIMKASHQWMSRPADQRFTSLPDMLAFKTKVQLNSRAKVLSSRSIEVNAIEGDDRGIEVVGPNGGAVIPTNWSFNQLAAVAKAPAGYLRNLPAPLAADCINYGLITRDVEDVGVLLYNDPDSGEKQGELSAITGPNYGRIWDSTIIRALMERFGDGVTGDFKVPGEFGHDVVVDRNNTTLYASDRDMFVFLADEKNRIEISDRRDGKPGSFARGFFVWNSQVGSKTFGIATFLFDYVCCNRIVWGAQEYGEITLRHTSSAPDRWIEEVSPAIAAYANSSARNVTQAIEAAKATRLEMDVTEFLAKRRQFSRRMASAVVAAHQADENRPMETIFDVVTGVTAYARGISHQDQRVDLERAAGEIMDLAA